MKKRISKNDVIRYCIMTLCAVVFVIAVANIWSIFDGYRRAENAYKEIADGFDNIVKNTASGFSIQPMSAMSSSAPMENYDVQQSSPGNINAGSPSYIVQDGTVEFQSKLKYLNELKSQNSDIYGFIQIDGTEINYPLVQAEDNEYYLKRGFNKKYSGNGSIFVDYRNSRTVGENKNIVIYGHNMLNGSMFHDIARFDKALHDDAEEYFFSHDEIKITAFDGIYTFKIFAFYHTTDVDPFVEINFYSDEAFDRYCSTAIGRSMYDTGIEVGAGDTTITLVTCVNGKPHERYACHAKLIKVQS